MNVKRIHDHQKKNSKELLTEKRKYATNMVFNEEVQIGVFEHYPKIVV